jgi:hypothetical protein
VSDQDDSDQRRSGPSIRRGAEVAIIILMLRKPKWSAAAVAAMLALPAFGQAHSAGLTYTCQGGPQAGAFILSWDEKSMAGVMVVDGFPPIRTTVRATGPRQIISAFPIGKPDWRIVFDMTAPRAEMRHPTSSQNAPNWVATMAMAIAARASGLPCRKHGHISQRNF